MKYLDFETKRWKPFPSMATLDEATEYFCAEFVGNYLYIAANPGVIYRYHIVNNEWETLPHFKSSSGKIKCLCSVDDYLFAITECNLLRRYSLAQNKWQSGSKLPFVNESDDEDDKFTSAAAVVMKSKIYVLHGYYKAVVVHCFDPQKNKWIKKASTLHPHFRSTLLVDNNTLYVVGGYISVVWRPILVGFSEEDVSILEGDPAPVEVYDEACNRWSVVKQKHIPPNNLGAVEINGKVYFIINKFPVDIGIRIPPGEVYHISLQEWDNYAKISENAVLCYLPVKKDSLKKKQSSEEKNDVNKTPAKKK